MKIAKTMILRLGLLVAVVVSVAGCRCSSEGTGGTKGAVKASKVPEVLSQYGLEGLKVREVDWSRYAWEYRQGPEWIDVHGDRGEPFDVALDEGDVVVFPFEDGRRLMVVASVSTLDDEGKWTHIQGYRRADFEDLYEYAEKELKDYIK